MAKLDSVSVIAPRGVTPASLVKALLRIPTKVLLIVAAALIIETVWVGLLVYLILCI